MIKSSRMRIGGRSSFGVLVLLATIAALMLAATSARASFTYPPAPVVFVHGNSGSAQQFESNAMRFSSNFYPDKMLYAYEYNTSAPPGGPGSDNTAAINNLDGFIANVQAITGASQVDVLAHSRGTTVMHAYLSTPERAANVRKYVNLDGRSSATPPGGVPTLAIWGGLQPLGSIGGATNVYNTERGHTETATSAENFKTIYKFLVGFRPLTASVIPELPWKVEISGRAVFFPLNIGVASVLEVWELNGATGARTSSGPANVITIGADGSFGPIGVKPNRHYELAIVRPGQPTTHFYFERFEHSDHFVRLLLSPPGGIGTFVTTGPNHTAVTTTRMREWWADQADPANNDKLEFNGVNVLNAATSPRGRFVLAAFAFDKNADTITDLSASLFPFSVLAFLTGVDLYLPASADASGTIAVKETVRSSGGKTRTINVPNWPSDQNGVSVYFKDYLNHQFPWIGG